MHIDFRREMWIHSKIVQNLYVDCCHYVTKGKIQPRQKKLRNDLIIVPMENHRTNVIMLNLYRKQSKMKMARSNENDLSQNMHHFRSFSWTAASRIPSADVDNSTSRGSLPVLMSSNAESSMLSFRLGAVGGCIVVTGVDVVPTDR